MYFDQRIITVNLNMHKTGFVFEMKDLRCRFKIFESNTNGLKVDADDCMTVIK